MISSSVAVIDLNAGQPNLGVPAISAALEDAGLPWERFEPRIAGTLPAETHRGIILTGGPGSPLEDAAWRDRLLQWMEQAIPHSTVLGICMGCQLLAHLHGWQLVELDTPRFGLYPLGTTEDGSRDAILGNLSPAATVFEQRRWGLASLGSISQGTALACSEEGEPTALRFNSRCFGTIFHPEAAPEPVHQWLTENQSAQEKLKLRHGVQGFNHQIARCQHLDSVWTNVIPRFVQLLTTETAT